MIEQLRSVVTGYKPNRFAKMPKSKSITDEALSKPAIAEIPSWPKYSTDEAELVSRVLLSNKVNYWTG